ncbi:helix-turn-helix domain-containing protein [Streptomyces sp. NPDC001513]|uniref:helix-turn-helix domain-containing protein n=1 Tax=Streptomyces sp. NPDC001513 TaxID=3364580 RepID=UPI0036B7D57C
MPEVAELGNMLTDLFNALGVSQRAYAVRVHLDPSAVSRFLRGQRVATEDFVDRLIREVGQSAEPRSRRKRGPESKNNAWKP